MADVPIQPLTVTLALYIFWTQCSVYVSFFNVHSGLCSTLQHWGELRRNWINALNGLSHQRVGSTATLKVTYFGHDSQICTCCYTNTLQMRKQTSVLCHCSAEGHTTSPFYCTSYCDSSPEVCLVIIWYSSETILTLIQGRAA